MADKTSVVIKLLISLIGFLAVIFLAFASWAYSMGIGQASLNVKMDNVIKQVKKIDGIEDRLTKIETVVEIVHNKGS